MYDDLQGKSIVITGAGAGIGRATALAFGRAGARVMASDMDRERGEATVAAIHQAGGQARFHQCDVSVSTDVEALMAATVAPMGSSTVRITMRGSKAQAVSPICMRRRCGTRSSR